MYLVTIYHNHPEVIKGDTGQKLEMINQKTFKTRIEAKAFIEDNLYNKDKVRRDYHKGNLTSRCIYFTGKTWFNECTGDTNDEYYQYEMCKL